MYVLVCVVGILLDRAVFLCVFYIFFIFANDNVSLYLGHILVHKTLNKWWWLHRSVSYHTLTPGGSHDSTRLNTITHVA